MRGFSLLELLIVLVIVGILAAFATVSYSHYLLRAYRADAKAELTSLAQAQERYRSASQPVAYAKDFVELGRLPASSTPVNQYSISDGRYKIEMPSATDSAFKIIAKAQGAQTKDTACASFSIDQSGRLKAVNANGETSSEITERCWSR